MFEPYATTTSPSHILNLAWEIRTVEVIGEERPCLIREC